jgi:hypothetical protein
MLYYDNSVVHWTFSYREEDRLGERRERERERERERDWDWFYGTLSLSYLIQLDPGSFQGNLVVNHLTILASCDFVSDGEGLFSCPLFWCNSVFLSFWLCSYVPKCLSNHTQSGWFLLWDKLLFFLSNFNVLCVAKSACFLCCVYIAYSKHWWEVILYRNFLY